MLKPTKVGTRRPHLSLQQISQCTVSLHNIIIIIIIIKIIVGYPSL